jgi:hypothetical protein
LSTGAEFRRKVAEMGFRPTRLPTAAIALALAGALIGSGLITDQSQAKTQNPLAGRWTGMTEVTPTWSGPPAPISFRITKAGYVVNLTTTVTLDWPAGNPPGCSSAPPAPVSMPSVRLNKPVPGFPKGKRFDYSSPGPGLVHADGKVITARKMEGGLNVRRVAVPAGLTCGTGNVHYTVKRAGG